MHVRYRRGVVLTYIVSMLTHVYKVTTSVASSVAARTMRLYARGCGRVKPTETSQYCTEVVEGNVRGLFGSACVRLEEVMRACRGVLGDSVPL